MNVNYLYHIFGLKIESAITFLDMPQTEGILMSRFNTEKYPMRYPTQR